MSDTRQPHLFVPPRPSQRHSVFDGDAFGARPRAAIPRDTATLNGKVAALFRSRPNEWIDGQAIAAVGGCYAWRTRVSEIRRWYGLDITNRQRRQGRRIVSEYRLVVDPEPVSGEHDDAA